MIKSGYQLHITTWENDGDHYKTQIFSGLSEEDVKFYVHIVKRFGSTSRDIRNLGNDYNTADVLLDLVEEALSTYPEISKELSETVHSYLDASEYREDIIEFYTDILGSPDECYYDEYGFCRAMGSFKVFYIPMDIEEVTKRFK